MSNNLGQCKPSLPLSHSAVVLAAAAALPAGSQCAWQRESTTAGLWERKHTADEKGGVQDFVQGLLPKSS